LEPFPNLLSELMAQNEKMAGAYGAKPEAFFNPSGSAHA
jgi:hypothetical protein